MLSACSKIALVPAVPDVSLLYCSGGLGNTQPISQTREQSRRKEVWDVGDLIGDLFLPCVLHGNNAPNN